MAKGGDRLVAEIPEARLSTAARVRPEERTEKIKELSLRSTTVSSGETREGR